MTNKQALTDPLADIVSEFNSLPDYSDVRAEHFEPAFLAALREHQVLILQIANNPDPPTFENTILALEISGTGLQQIVHNLLHFAAVLSSEPLQQAMNIAQKKLAHSRIELLQNERLSSRIRAIANLPQFSTMGAEKQAVIRRYVQMVNRAGATLDGPQRKELVDIEVRLAQLSNEFVYNLKEAEKAASVHVLSPGLDPLDMSAPATYPDLQLGKPDSLDSVEINLTKSRVDSILKECKSPSLRAVVWNNWTNRCSRGDAWDNTRIASQILSLRSDLSRLLGYTNYAEMKLTEQTVGGTENAINFLTEIWPSAKCLASEELNEMIELGEDLSSIEPSDWQYYRRHNRRPGSSATPQDFAFDFNNVLNAVFWVARSLFDLEIQPLPTANLYHPDVLAFRVSEKDDKTVGFVICDHMARQSKRSGAWTSAIRPQQKEPIAATPITALVFNFETNSNGDIRLSFEEARSVFHEFGHVLHNLLSDVTYPMIAGANVSSDFVEFSALLFEKWMQFPKVIDMLFPKSSSGQAVPINEVISVFKASEKRESANVVGYIASAMLDLKAHSKAPDEIDIDDLEQRLARHLKMPEGHSYRYRLSTFAHLFASEFYASSYYTYYWADALATDVFQAFIDDPFEPRMASSLRTKILSCGGAVNPFDAYSVLLNKKPDFKSFSGKIFHSGTNL